LKQDREWVRWFSGFSCLLGGVFDKAESEFLYMAVSSSDALIAGVSAYFLANNLAEKSLRKQDCLAAAETGRKRVVDTLISHDAWKKEVSKAEKAIHIAIIRKYIDGTGIWLFRDIDTVPIVQTNINNSLNKDSKKQGSQKTDSKKKPRSN